MVTMITNRELTVDLKGSHCHIELVYGVFLKSGNYGLSRPECPRVSVSLGKFQC